MLKCYAFLQIDCFIRVFKIVATCKPISLKVNLVKSGHPTCTTAAVQLILHAYDIKVFHFVLSVYIQTNIPLSDHWFIIHAYSTC